MQENYLRSCSVFDGDRLIASGTLVEVVRSAKDAVDRHGRSPVLIFDNATSEVIDVDYRGTADDVVARLEQESKSTGQVAHQATSISPVRRGPGRPRLGVVSKEVTLLPQHWTWLKSQPGGASATLRRLVHDARKQTRTRDTARRSQGATLQFMTIMAGNRPGFEEAARSLYAGDRKRFASITSSWPADVRQHVLELAEPAFLDTACEDSEDR